MAERSIPVDLLNPGQVFACIGLMEAAEVLLGGAEGAFDWTGAQSSFTLRAAGDADPVEAVIGFLWEAEVTAVAPMGAGLSVPKMNNRLAAPEEGAPGPGPRSPATLPAELTARGKALRIEHWGDGSSRDGMKFWAGMGGYSGAALAQDALWLMRNGAADVKRAFKPLPKAEAQARFLDAVRDPFNLAARQSSSFRLDWRRDYVPIDAGFSPNQHGWLTMQGFPLVELLAALGLSHARPERVRRMLYRYGVLGGAMLPPMFHRAALGAPHPPAAGLPFRRFAMHLAAPGKDDRCISSVERLEQEEWT
jgi:CRISPR-associated protein Csb3